MIFQTLDQLQRLNSATKYPSIPTYHRLGDRGMLTEDYIDFPDGDVIATEKIDGTNARVIFAPEQYFIGSREELLHAKGDLIINPTLGIVETLKPLADQLWKHIAEHYLNGSVLTMYFEVFGGKCSAASKQYSGTGKISFRLFDISEIQIYQIESNSPAQLAQWRDNGGQYFWTEEPLHNFTRIPIAPRLSYDETLPTTILETYQWLENICQNTECKLDSEAKGSPEGVVVRTKDRRAIAKIRYEDYTRTLKKLGKL